ncbi:hypothetical protein [Agriterribacter sp.]|nr:hypothetical protein [Agriterribacter sp.]HTN08336.1 hypothetical protein [Agriterribacter sp.]
MPDHFPFYLSLIMAIVLLITLDEDIIRRYLQYLDLERGEVAVCAA